MERTSLTPTTTPAPPQQHRIAPARSSWSPRSLAILAFVWVVLQFGGLFAPGLLDDVDSIYIEIAREMLLRHDYVTPYIDGVRFFDKPPLMYWMAAGSMHLFGTSDWAARLPLALCVLLLLFAIYGLGIRLYQPEENQHGLKTDRAGFYAALAMATAIGPYLYTRFFIPDILLALWMTLGVHLFLIARDRIAESRSTLAPMTAFGAVMAANVMTKGLIGIVFPIGFVLFYLLITRSLRQLGRLNLPASIGAFLLLAAPWHILAALRNPAIPLPSGVELPAHGGWAWFYLINEHPMRFLGRRVPHDYGQTPQWLFLALAALWMMPWAVYLPGAVLHHRRALRARLRSLVVGSITRLPDSERVPALQSASSIRYAYTHQPQRRHPLIAWLHSNRLLLASPFGAVAFAEESAGLTLLLWAGLVLCFFLISSRQEYYSLPALPALALLAGGLLARADWGRSSAVPTEEQGNASRSALLWSLWGLTPLATAAALACGYYAVFAPRPREGADVSSLMAQNPELYNLSLGHIFDLTAAAMGFFRGPLATVAIAMLAVGPLAYLLRRRGMNYAANLTLAAGMTGTLLAAHAGLAAFYPILGSKGLAQAIVRSEHFAPWARTRPDLPAAAPEPDLSGHLAHANDLVVLDGELTSGSSLIFYTQQPVHLVNGRVNGPWYGSFWPDAPPIFETEASLRALWGGPQRVYLLTYDAPKRRRDLSAIAPVNTIAAAGGKTILTNR